LTRIGVITGISREADCLSVFGADQRPTVQCSGASSNRALTQARALIAGGCGALVSFGIAGGLRPDLAPGTVVVADVVVTPDGRRLETSAPWRESLLTTCGAGAGLVVGVMAGAGQIVGGVAEKQALAARTGAAAVDMESHAVAEAGAEAGVPVMVIRAVADAAGRRLPAWVATCVAADGSRRWGAVAAGVIRHPWDFPALLALAADSEKALAALRRVAGRAGPLFGLP
jgi:adenosylhomocysteine nucleosidase